jgi:hypothetical protein
MGIPPALQLGDFDEVRAHPLRLHGDYIASGIGSCVAFMTGRRRAGPGRAGPGRAALTSHLFLPVVVLY